MKAVIMAGGKGTRIASIASDIPKPMIRIGGKPILEHQIDNLKACGLTDITLVIGYMGNVIQNYFKDGSDFGVSISYFIEEHPLGTAGALFKMSNLEDDFLLLCGDVMIDVDFNRFIRFHHEHQALASLMAHPNGHPYDSSILVTEILPPQEKGGMPIESHRVVGWLNKEEERTCYNNRVNAGIEIISPDLLRQTMMHFTPRHPEQPDKIDLDRDVLKPNIPSGRIFAYDTPEYIKDMGTPDRFYEVEHDLKSGMVAARNLSKKQKAVFLDRDGVINEDIGLVYKPTQIRLIDGVAEALNYIHSKGFLAVVVTNQSVIARNLCTFEELATINATIETLLGKEHAYLDGLYLCPHHPDWGYPEERKEYKTKCSCRKPAPGLIINAAKNLNIDIGESFMIGDRPSDLQAGQNAGVKVSVMIPTNEADSLLNTLKTLL